MVSTTAKALTTRASVMSFDVLLAGHIGAVVGGSKCTAKQDDHVGMHRHSGKQRCPSRREAGEFIS